MNKKIILIILTIIVGLIGMLVLISGLFNKKQPTILDDTTTTIELEVINTNIPSKQKKTKKVLKTTKKTTKKIIKKSKVKGFNIKYNKNEIVNYTYQEVIRRWGEDNWKATYNIISHESGWNPNSYNKKSTACGLFQAKPCSKTIKNGYKEYSTNWKTQVHWGLDYIQIKYKTPINAWKHWKKYGSY